MTSVTTPFILTPGGTKQLTAKFSPTVTGSANGTITVTSNATNPTLSIPLVGTGVTASGGTLTATPPSLSFGNINVGSSSALNVTVTNSGGTSVTVSNVAISGAEFSMTSVTTPFILAPGGTKQLTAKFSPTVAGSANGTITVTSDATNPTLSIPLSGTGVTVVQHSVNLGWNVSTSQVIGYNVYRSTSSTGSFSLLNTALIPSPSYVDQAVQSGYTYYYYATAVDSQQRESVASNQTSATIP